MSDRVDSRSWHYKHDINQRLLREIYEGGAAAEESDYEIKQKPYYRAGHAGHDLSLFAGPSCTLGARITKFLQKFSRSDEYRASLGLCVNVVLVC